MTDGRLLGVSVLELRTDQRQLDAGLAQAERKVDASGNRMAQTVGKHMETAGKKMSSAGSSLSTHLTLPLIALGAAAGDMASKFDQAMEMVHTQSGASQKEVDNLRGKVLELARTSTQGPVELANALYRLEGAGYRGAKAMAALKAASDLAAVGNANVEDTTKTLTQVLKPGIKGVKDFNDAVAQINATVGAGDLRLQPLVDALGTGVVTAAKQAGLSFQDVTGALAVFGDETKNVDGWSAQLATAFHFMTNPTQKAVEALKSIHLHADSLSKDMDKPQGLLTALRDLKSHLDALPKDKAKEVLGDIFPGGRGRVLEVLLNQTDLLAQKMHQIQNTSGQFPEAVVKSQQEAANKIHIAWSNLQVDAIDFGEKVLPTLLKDGEVVVQDVEKVTTAFTSLPKGAQDAIITGGLITAGIGPALKLLGLFSTVVGKAYGLGSVLTKIAAGRGLGAFKSGGGSSAEQFATGLSGVRGTGVGSETNPLAVVMMDAKYTNLGGRAAPIGTTEPVSGESRSPGGVILPAGVEAPAGTLAEGEVATAAGAGALASAREGLARGMQGLLIGSIGVGASQAIGAAVHGSVGKAISSIGTDASIGAGLGAFFGPEGIAGGAIIGGLVGTFQHFASSESTGQKIADSLSKGFGGPSAEALKKQVATALNDANKILQSTAERPGPHGATIKVPIQLDPSQLSPEKLVQFDDYMKTAGGTIAKQLEAGWNQFRFQSEPVMLTQLRAEIQRLPPEAQSYAIQSATAFMRGLESQGRVAKGSTDQFLMDIMREFPGAVRQMGVYGTEGVKAFIKALDFSHAQDQLRSQLGKVEDDFSGVQKAVHDTSGSIEDKSAAAITALLGIERQGSGPMRKAAVADIKALRQTIEDDFDAMTTKVASAAQSMSKNLQAGSQQATKIVTQNYASLAQGVYGAMQSGAMNAKQGAEYMDKAFVATMKAFGKSGIPPVVLQEIALSTPFSASVGAFPKTGVGGGGKPAGAAGGGLFQIGMPGEAGYDSVPLNVGGMPIMVAPGEQVAVFNRHQLPVVNAALAGFGGLPGLFDAVSTPNYMARGGMVSGLAAGGTLSYGQLEQLWISAGGPAGVASVAAAIALAESRGQDVMQQGQPFATTGWGYWQITPGGPQYLDPMTNARAAVAKYDAAHGFSPWTTYNDGAYRAFLKGGVPPQAAAMLASVVAPKVKGSGLIADALRASFGKEASAANAFLANLAPAVGGAVGPAGGGFDPSQLTTFQGVRVAKWIANELAYAQAHGWHGRITSGYRPGFDPHTVNGFSEHSLDVYPGGAVDFGGMIDPAGLANKDAFFAAAAGYPSSEKLIAPIGFRDDGHASGTGHARGGLLRFARGGMVPGFASGGLPAHLASAPKKYTKAPKQHKQPKTTVRTLPSIAAANPVLSQGLSRLNALLGDSGQIATLQDRYTATDSLFNATNPNLTFVVTSDPITGQSVAPYIDWGAVNTAVDHYTELIDWEQQIIGWYQESMGLIPALIKKIQHAIAERLARIAAIKAHIARNLQAIATLSKSLQAAEQAKLPSGKHVSAAQHSAAQAAKTRRVNALKAQIAGLKDDNAALGGDRDKIGTGGQLGGLSKQLQSLQQSLSMVQGDRTTVVGLSGIGGELGDARVNLTTLQGELGPLGTDILGQQLAAAQASFAPATRTSATDATLLGLLQQQNTTLAGQYAVSQAQYKVLAALPPFGGSFAAGGIVPGPIGAARTAILHGGERVTPVGGHDGASIADARFSFHFANGMEWLRDVIRVEVEHGNRKAVRMAARQLPGRGGGQLLPA